MGLGEKGSWFLDEKGSRLTPNVLINSSPSPCSCCIDKWLGNLVNEFAPNKTKISLQRALIDRISQNVISEDSLEAVGEL